MDHRRPQCDLGQRLLERLAGILGRDVGRVPAAILPRSVNAHPVRFFIDGSGRARWFGLPAWLGATIDRQWGCRPPD